MPPLTPMLAAVLLKPDAPAPAVVETLARLCAPWQSLYSDSKVLSTAVVTVHIVALLFGGGLAIAADRATLRLARGRSAPDAAAEERRLLADLGAVHRPVLVALALLFVSGILLATADVKTYALSWVFWLKIGLVALLLVNGVVLERAERVLHRGGAESATGPYWGRLRAASWASLALWTATTVVGVALTNAA